MSINLSKDKSKGDNSPYKPGTKMVYDIRRPIPRSVKPSASSEKKKEVAKKMGKEIKSRKEYPGHGVVRLEKGKFIHREK